MSYNKYTCVYRQYSVFDFYSSILSPCGCACYNPISCFCLLLMACVCCDPCKDRIKEVMEEPDLETHSKLGSLCTAAIKFLLGMLLSLPFWWLTPHFPFPSDLFPHLHTHTNTFKQT